MRLYEIWQSLMGYCHTQWKSPDFWWLVFGFSSQLAFFARFLIQWLASERAGRSVVPIAFWYFSIIGGVTILIYAIHKTDPVFIVGQAGGLAIYVRNLMLIHRRSKTE